MLPNKITSSTVALILGGLFLLLVGTYTGNGGFQFAGALLLAVGVIVAIRQATRRKDAG